MLNGDLSNKVAPIVAFNLDTLLFTDKILKKDGFLDGILRKVTMSSYNERDDYLNREINTNTLRVISNLWRNYDVTVVLVTFKPFVKDIDTYLYDSERFLYYNYVKGFNDLEDVRIKLLSEYAYFVDNDYNTINSMPAGAIHIQEIGKIFPYKNNNTLRRKRNGKKG